MLLVLPLEGGGCTWDPKDRGSSLSYNEALPLSFWDDATSMFEEQHLLPPSPNPCVSYFALKQNPYLSNFHRAGRLFPAQLQFISPFYVLMLFVSTARSSLLSQSLQRERRKIFSYAFLVTSSSRSKPETSDCSTSACFKQSNSHYSCSRKTFLYVWQLTASK